MLRVSDDATASQGGDTWWLLAGDTCEEQESSFMWMLGGACEEQEGKGKHCGDASRYSHAVKPLKSCLDLKWDVG